MWGRMRVALVGLAIAAGCADAPIDEEPASENTDPGVAEDAAPMWRIDLVGSANEATVQSIGRITVSAGAAMPRPALGGEYLVISYAGDVVVEAVPLHFATSTALLGAGPDGETFELEVPVDSAPAAVFMRADPSVDRIEVVSASGEIAETITADELPTTTMRTSDLLGSEYDHIAFLEAGEESMLPAVLFDEYVANIVDPDAELAGQVLDGLADIAPATAGAVSQIAIVDMIDYGCRALSSACEREEPQAPNFCDERGVAFEDESGQRLPSGWILGAAIGSTLFLNVETMESSRYTMVHEVTHCLNNLLDATAANAGESLWTADVRAAAAETIDGNRLGVGLTQVWSRAHGTAADAGVAGAYFGDQWCAKSMSEAYDAGFASPYGGKHPKEDIAELTAKVQAKGAEASVCQSLQTSGSELSEDHAIVYAKLVMLREIGAITPAKFDACVGPVEIGGGPGIHLGDTISFESDVRSGWYEDEGVEYFAVTGEGPNTYKLAVRVETAAGESPVGLHRLDSIHFFNIAYANNGAFLAHDDPFRARASGSGLVLITEANEERTRGAIFALSFQNAFGADTDVFPYATFLVE